MYSLSISQTSWRGITVAMLLAGGLAGCQEPTAEEQQQALEQAEQEAALAAVATQEPAAGTPAVGDCDASQVQGLVGQAFSDAVGQQATQDAEAKQLRVLAPDTAATMDFLGERLNIEVDEKRIITGVRCG